MAIIHGNWILDSECNSFWIWGEAWRSLVNLELATNDRGVLIYPFTLSEEELSNLLQEYRIASNWQTRSLKLPTIVRGKGKKQQYLPIFSGDNLAEISQEETIELHLWEVSGFTITADSAINFLQQIFPLSLPSDAGNLGADLRFWCHIYRWVLDLIVRHKFLPGIDLTINKSVWQPLLDSDQDLIRLAKFTRSMPLVCWMNLEDQSEQEFLLQALGIILDNRIITWKNINVNLPKNISIKPWLQSLTETDSLLRIEPKNLARLSNALHNWTLPIQEYLVSSDNNNLAKDRYRLCVSLQPPKQQDSEVQGDWQLQYLLQALDEPEFTVDAATIWRSGDRLTVNNRTIIKPQESLLKGLGLATRIYEPIKDSLNTSNPEGCQLNPIQVYEFIRATAWQLQNNGLGVILPPGLASGDSEQRLGIKITAGVSRSKDRLNLQSLLDYKLEIAVGNKIISQQDFANLLAQKSPIIEIDGQWLALQPADVRSAQAVLNQSNEQINLSVEDALRLSTGDTKILSKLPVVNFEVTGILQELINNLTDNKSVSAIDNIPGFNGQLRPYQAKGVGWLSFLETWGLGACLADDMGLGKTIQLIAFLLNLKQQNILTKPTLLICPTSVINNWEREVKKFAPSLKTLIHHGDKRDKGKTFALLVKDKQLVITSYSLVDRDLKTLVDVEWQGIVLDEAQNVKNSGTKQAQAVRQLSAGFKIALTGTPVENRLGELWSILDFLNPGFLGNKSFFQKRFAMPIEKYGDRDSLNTLRSLVQPFILRRLKTDRDIIQDLPEKQEMNVFCGLSAEQAELYQKLVEKSLVEIEDSEGIKRRGLILTLLLRLKQLCNHPDLIKGKTTKNNINFAQKSGKLLRLEEMLEELIAEGDQALIFTQFSEWGKLIQPYLTTKLKSEVLFLYGSTKRQDRQEMVDRFQNDPNGPKIFILSLKAGGTGLNLTKANHVFHVDRWWNPAVENQATDRAFRIGQKRNVQVHKFICSGTLEEKINDLIESKKDLAEQTVNAGEQWLTDLDTDRLRNLLLLDRDAIIDE
jgi:SNF2 family DNA or RNA helicase